LRAILPPRRTKKKKEEASAPKSSQNARNAKERAKNANDDAKFKRDKFLSRNNLPFVNLLDKDVAVNALLLQKVGVADMISLFFYA
jgi:hypothetical protein